jgi:hypothetical protein
VAAIAENCIVQRHKAVEKYRRFGWYLSQGFWWQIVISKYRAQLIASTCRLKTFYAYVVCIKRNLWCHTIPQWLYYREFNWKQPRSTASLAATFSHSMWIILVYNIIYRMLHLVLDITFFSSQTCLTSGEQIIKYCLKFVSRYCRYCKPGDFLKLVLCMWIARTCAVFQASPHIIVTWG